MAVTPQERPLGSCMGCYLVGMEGGDEGVGSPSLKPSQAGGVRHALQDAVNGGHRQLVRRSVLTRQPAKS